MSETPHNTECQHPTTDAPDVTVAVVSGDYTQLEPRHAFGAPGIASTQGRGDKDAIAATRGTSRVWATLAEGIVTEVFWPTVSEPQVRDIGFLVGGNGWWCEVRSAGRYTVDQPGPGVLVPTVHHVDDRFELDVRIVCHHDSDAVSVDYTLRPAPGVGSLVLHALIAPHLDGAGHANCAWIDNSELVASGPSGTRHLAVVCEPAPTRGSVGFVGASDGWQDFNQHGTCTYDFTAAENGNVAGLLSLPGCLGTLTVGFGETADLARSVARAASAAGTVSAVRSAEAGWQHFSEQLTLPGSPDLAAEVRQSAAVIAAHIDVENPGAIVASLATPWGFSHDDPGGYHLVWPRDCVESALALAALNDLDGAVATLRFLATRQSADGHWPQNFTAAGAPYWTGLQLDETALPVVLAVRLGELGTIDVRDAEIRSMVRSACMYLAAHGPLTGQDRWEETAGASPFTIAAVIAALAGAALTGWLEPIDADAALSIADWWNDRIEDLTFVTGSPMDTRYDVAGHYERIGTGTPGGRTGDMVIANRSGERAPFESIVGLEFLAYVRQGLRSPTDPRITDTVRVVDAELRVDLGSGPLYRRYQHDGYGEHPDGSPFDGSGVGQLWPLLSGERGAYALAAGEDHAPYLSAMLASANSLGLLPEQVWNGPAVVERRLQPGRPTGSATPLVWAHGEFVKLVHAAATGGHVDTVRAVRERYANADVHRAPAVAWLRDEIDALVRRGTSLRIVSRTAFDLHVGFDGWLHVADRPSSPGGLGLHSVDVSAEELDAHTSVQWTRFNVSRSEWEHIDHSVRLL